MKDTVKFFSVVTGIFRSLVTILFLLGIGFTILVDSKLLMSFLDLLGFQGISENIVKPILILIFAVLFIINLIITRHIYKSGDYGEYHLSNFVFGLLFLALTAFIYITFKSLTTNLIFVFFVLNAILVLNSLLGLIAKARGLYPKEEIIASQNTRANDYIEFDDDNAENKITEDKDFYMNNLVDNTGKVKNDSDKKIRTDQSRTIKNSKEKPKQNKDQTKVLNKDEIKKESKNPKTEVVEDDQKTVFESHEYPKKEIASSTKTSRPVSNKKVRSNNVSYENEEKDEETYGNEHKEKIVKEKEDKVFDKSQFTKIKIDDINEENN